MTVREIAKNTGNKVPSIQRNLKRNGFGKFGINDVLPKNAITHIMGDQAGPAPSNSEEVEEVEVVEKVELPKKETPVKKEGKLENKKVGEAEKIIREALALLPLPMLGLAACYGVYLFASRFVPGWVAVIEAGGFEFVYIGLAAMRNLNDQERKKAMLISMGAVGVSMTYNALAAALEMQPDLFENLDRFWFWVIAITHGAPLALLSFLVADLILHRD